MFCVFKLVFLGGVVCLFVHLFAVLRNGGRELGMLGKRSATKLQPQPCSLILKIEMLL